MNVLTQFADRDVCGTFYIKAVGVCLVLTFGGRLCFVEPTLFLANIVYACSNLLYEQKFNTFSENLAWFCAHSFIILNVHYSDKWNRYHTLKFIPPTIVNEMLHQNATSSTFKDFLPSFGEQDSTLDIILWTFHKAFQGLTSKVKNFASYILLLSRNGVTKKLPIFHCIFSVHCLWMRLQKIQR